MVNLTAKKGKMRIVLNVFFISFTLGGPQCGKRNPNGLGVENQGITESESQFGEWPHMCAILHEKPIEQDFTLRDYSDEPQKVNLYQCGGSLIAPGVILTAAHCVDKFNQNPTELNVRCGEWDTQEMREDYPFQKRYVQTLNIHPEFDGDRHNDIALVFTSKDFVLTDHIDTVCLPQADELYDGASCFVFGWGKDKFGSAEHDKVVLQETDLSVVNNYECQEILRSNTRLGKRFRLHDSFLCAGGINGKDTFKGDGGSPLVCPSKDDSNTFVQAGVVSWGIGWFEDGVPAVCASVSKASGWIDDAMMIHQREKGVGNKDTKADQPVAGEVETEAEAVVYNQTTISEMFDETEKYEIYCCDSDETKECTGSECITACTTPTSSTINSTELYVVIVNNVNHQSHCEGKPEGSILVSLALCWIAVPCPKVGRQRGCSCCTYWLFKYIKCRKGCSNCGSALYLAGDGHVDPPGFPDY